MPHELHGFKRLVIYLAAAFLTVAGVMVNGSQLYYMAAVLVALPAISYALGVLALRDLDFLLEAPSSGWEGETTTLQVIARSRARTPRMFLQAHIHLPRWLVPAEDVPPTFHVPARGEVNVPCRIELQKRGAYALRSVTVTARDPLGIYSFSRSVGVSAEILVYPVPQAIPQLPMSGSERFGIRDLPVAAVRGSGVDPDGVREYVPGDPLRHMHWRSTAKTGRLSVIEFEESRAISLVLVVDLRRGTDVGPGKETTLEHMVRAAASLAQEGVRQGAAVRLVAGGAASPADFAGRGSEHLYTILAALARAEADDPEPLAGVLVSRVGLLPAGATLVVLTADAHPDLPGALAHYTATGAEAVAVYADPGEYVHGKGPAPTSRAFLEGLMAARALPVLLRPGGDGAIRLDSIHDVRFLDEPNA